MGWGGGIKRDTTDDLFSKAVRGRVGYVCEKTGRYFPVGERMGLHCAHYFGRRNKAVRFDPDNAFSLSAAAHRHFDENPDEFREWVKEKLGPVRFAALRARSLIIRKITPGVRAFINDKLRTSLAEMDRLRDMGITERISFGSPYPLISDAVHEPARKRAKAKAKGPKKKIQSRPFPKTHRPLRAA